MKSPHMIMIITIFERGFIVPTSEKLSCKNVIHQKRKCLQTKEAKLRYSRKSKTQPNPRKRRHQLEYERKHVKPPLTLIHQISPFYDRNNKNPPYKPPYIYPEFKSKSSHITDTQKKR